MARFRTVGAGVVLDKVTYRGDFEWNADDERVKRMVESGHLVEVSEPVELSMSEPLRDLPRNLEVYVEPDEE